MVQPTNVRRKGDIRIMKRIKTPIEHQWFTRTLVVIAIGIALRCLVSFIVLGNMPQVEDGPSYSLQAQQMIDGTIGYYYFPPGTAISVVPFYWLLGQTVFVDHLIGVVHTSAFLIIAAWFASVMLGWGRVTFIAAMFVAFYPNSFLSATQISSMPVSVVFLTGAIGLILRCHEKWSWHRWIGASLCLAAAIATRPASVMAIVVIAIAGMYLLWQRKINVSLFTSAAMALCVIMASMIVPLMQHNFQHGHGWTLSTNNEWNLFAGNTPYTPDYKTGHFGQRRFDQVSPEARAYMSAILPHESPTAATYEQRKSMRAAAFDYMQHHPIRTLYRVTNRARAFWGFDYATARTIQNEYGLSNLAFLPIVALDGGGYLLLIMLALSAPFILQLPFNAKGAFLLSLCAAGMIPYLIAFAQARYHLSAIPLLLIPASLAIIAFLENPKHTWQRLYSRPLWWAVMAAFLLMQAESAYYLILLR